MTSSGDQIFIATPSEIYIFIFSFAFFGALTIWRNDPELEKKRGEGGGGIV
jgi:hypothetical protein